MIRFELATAADDEALRRLLRENPMPGAIAVTFEREPCYFDAAALDGPLHQAFVSRDGGEITAMGSRSARPMFINGAVQMVGYLSQLRVSQRYARGLFLARGLAKGFAFCHALHADGVTSFYLTSLIADNAPTRRLMEAGLPGYPAFHPYARMHTYAIAPRRARRPLPLPRGMRLQTGSDSHLSRIVDCLQRNGVRRQFSPVWTATTLCRPEHTPGLRPESFILAVDGECVVGCLALWDQSRFKQNIVRSYSGVIGRWRRIVNLVAPLGGWPSLPPPNTPFRFCYASHLAVDDDNTQVFAALLRSLYNQAGGAGYDYFMIGLSENNPLRAVVTRTYPRVTYTSQLYLVAWPDGAEAVGQVDGRVPGPEIAVM